MKLMKAELMTVAIKVMSLFQRRWNSLSYHSSSHQRQTILSMMTVRTSSRRTESAQ